jgi:hypothetical protein
MLEVIDGTQHPADDIELNTRQGHRHLACALFAIGGE